MYEVTTQSETLRFDNLGDIVILMHSENYLEALEDIDIPKQFDIPKNIEAIRNLKPGMTWRHSLAVVKCLEE